MADVSIGIFRSPVGIGGLPPVAPVDRLRPATPQPVPQEGDSFVRGQYDRNRVVSAQVVAGTPRQEQARRAYDLQVRSGEGQGGGAGPAGVDAESDSRSPAAKGAEPGSPPPKGNDPSEDSGAKMAPVKGEAKASGGSLSAAARNVISQLAKIDRAVRSHENAHLAAAGGLAKGGASFTMAHGPDGRSYAVGGEVQIDTAPGATPGETIARMQAVRAAALAPADPSSQDLKVAAQAALATSQALQELSQIQSSAAAGKRGGAKPTTAAGAAAAETEAPPPAATSGAGSQTEGMPSEKSSENSGGTGWSQKYALSAAGTRQAAGSFDLIV